MKKRDILFFGGCAAVAAALLLTVDIQTPAEYYAAHPTAITKDGAFIELRVDSSAVPDGGVLLDGRYALAEGDSVFDVVERVLRAEGISLDYSGGSGTCDGSLLYRSYRRQKKPAEMARRVPADSVIDGSHRPAGVPSRHDRSSLCKRQSLHAGVDALWA